MCKPIKKWNDLLDYYNKNISAGNWVFRAEKDNGHPLVTSLDRAFADCDVSDDKKSEIEQKLIRSFRRRCHLHADVKMIAKNNLEIVALMQHYGAPTRALDWTYSFFVAVYFAINKHSGTENGVVWCLDKEWLNKKNETDTDNFENRFLEDEKYIKEAFYVEENKYKDKKKKLERLRKDSPSEFQNFIFNYIIKKNPEPFIYAATPYYLNDRLAIQQGALLFACDIKTSWKENFDKMMNNNESNKVLPKIVISNDKGIRKEFLKKLYDMNINQSSLFPGLGGFAESLTTRIAHLGSLGICEQ